MKLIIKHYNFTSKLREFLYATGLNFELGQSLNELEL